MCSGPVWYVRNEVMVHMLFGEQAFQRVPLSPRGLGGFPRGSGDRATRRGILKRKYIPDRRIYKAEGSDAPVDMDQKLAKAKEIADQLLSSERIDFKGLTPSRLEDELPVVYAITDKRDGKVLYVGRTNNLRRRLYTNHLMGPATNARLKKYLPEDPERPDIKDLEAAKQELIDHCYFQYIPVADSGKEKLRSMCDECQSVVYCDV